MRHEDDALSLPSHYEFAADLWLTSVESQWVGADATGRAHRTSWAITALHYSLMADHERSLEAVEDIPLRIAA